MKQFIFKNYHALAITVCCIAILVVTMSFQTLFGPMDRWDSLTEVQDSIPEKNIDNRSRMTMKDYDQLMLNMDKEILKVQEEISKIDLQKIHKDLSASLDNIDFDKIKLDIDRVMKQVDYQKIAEGVKTALKEVEWNKINNDVKKSLQEAKLEIDKINVDELKKEMEKAKLEIEKSKLEIKKINIDEVVKNANKEILRAKEELGRTKAMFNEMEKDGLINEKDGFTIEFKNNALLINCQRENDATRDKYRKYIKGDSYKITISKEKANSIKSR